MKPLDLLLLSVAIGLTCFTAHVFGSPLGAPADAPAAPATPLAELLEDHPFRNPAFRSIVLHHSATHGGSAAAFERNHRARLGGLAYHFIIGNGSGSEDGCVEAGYRWKDQVPGPHTKNQATNLESIAICLVGDLQSAPPTRAQTASLLDLLERLCRAGAIPPDRIVSHREADPETLCPGRKLPVDGIREVLSKRLGSPLRPLVQDRR
jgi:N-acetyl-anhydromuramyl-L-alanine amidase AmpD